MRVFIVWLALAQTGLAGDREDIEIAMAMALAVKPAPPKIEQPWNLRALTEQSKPIPAPARLPNIGSCVCNRTGGQCFCQPASDCAKGKCPALQQLRKDEIPYYFPTFDPNCPTGK